MEHNLERTAFFRDFNIPEDAIGEFSRNSGLLAEKTNGLFRALSDMEDVLYECPLSVVMDNHSNHFKTITSLMQIRRLDVLDSLIPWVYKTYLSHGVGKRYFPVIFKLYRQAVEETLSAETAEKIVPLYHWFSYNHDYYLDIVNTTPHFALNHDPNLVDKFVNTLVNGEYEQALSMVKVQVEEKKSLDEIYAGLFRPALTRVGDLWQENSISVAHEHIASAIVARLMIYLYNLLMPAGKGNKGTVLVASVVNEYHDIGAQMVSDFFEENGWKVWFMGSNVPNQEVMEFLSRNKPDILALSVAIPFNLGACRELVQAIRSCPDCEKVKIMVGGLAFSNYPDIWKSTGADYYAEDAEKAVKIAEDLLRRG
jgi:methanogenic corrinoid protein MtbC1